MMSVLNVSTKIIFCEGKLDAKLLEKVTENLENITIVPAQGKFTFSVFAQGYFANRKKQSKYLVFRDRDFDLLPTEQINLLEYKSMFLSYRTCVENYLLEPELIDQYWTEKYQEKLDNPHSKWGHKNSPGIEAIWQWIETSAKYIRNYQIIRWALGDLLRMSQSRTNLKTTWIGNNSLPSEDSLSLENCKQEAILLINQFRQDIESITMEKFETSLDHYLNLFTQETFWQNHRYLIWFNGKDLAKAMQKQKSNYISLKDFYDWIIAKIDIDKYPDLIQLRSKIINL